MTTINFIDIMNNRCILSPNNYKTIDLSGVKLIELSKVVSKVEKGIEVGSQNYIGESDYYFLRTSGFSGNYFTFDKNNNSYLKITPSVYENMNIKSNDVLICKDSNVGEVVYINKDMPNTMYSTGINKLLFYSNPKYYFALMKNNKFKEQLESLIPKGATLKHAKDLYLKCRIPDNKDQKVIKYVEDLVDIILDKEELIRNKNLYINKYIYNEIMSHQKKTNFIYLFPTLDEIKKINRLDTGNYTADYKFNEFKIMNYEKGYFYIQKECISGGNTPKKRYIANDENLKYCWVTPSVINDDGTFYAGMKIECEKNNINEDCILVINRTSKGGFGEYVGITSFYDFDRLGMGQHNQGIYKVSGYDRDLLIFMSALLNSGIYRKMCANLSMGSKMKELKLNNILQIPFPKFSMKTIRKIVGLYYNNFSKRYEVNEKNFVVQNKEWNKHAGLLDLYYSVQNIKTHLNLVINNIYDGDLIDYDYRIF